MSVEAEVHSDAVHVGHVALPIKKKTDPFETRWGKFLQACIKLDGSDLIMKSETQPKLRLRGALKPLDCEPVTGDRVLDDRPGDPLRGAARGPAQVRVGGLRVRLRRQHAFPA